MSSPDEAKGSAAEGSIEPGRENTAPMNGGIITEGPPAGSSGEMADKKEAVPPVDAVGEEGGGGNAAASTISGGEDPSRDKSNLQAEAEGSAPENIVPGESTANSQPGGKEGDDGVPLTVIDGPLAGGGMPDEASTGGGTASQKAVTDDRTHTPNSSMGSSLGELMGEASAILENGVLEHDASTSGSVMDLESTEKPGHKGHIGHHAHTKSTSDMPSAAAAAGEKPPTGFKHSTSSPPEDLSSAIKRGRSPPRPTRERVNSSQDILAEMGAGTDDDDDDENDIPPHIQSKIVEKSPAERYIRFKEKLGSGAYKDVYRAYDTIEGIEVAWNVVKLSGVPKAERIRIVNEVRLLERLHHPNIISFHGSWVNRETERVIFVTEILSSGTLKSFVQKVQLIRWKIFKRWAIQILKGLEYLHSQDPPIIHRDLKCDNIFINGTSGDLRIGDFGLSTAISKKNQPLSVLGTPEFMAPELYDENYNEKVDIYAFGMLLLEIITRDVPYHECTNPAQIYKKVTQGIPPPSLRRVKSKDAQDFILLCLGIGEDANERPSASDLLKHPFLAKKADDETAIEVEPAVEDMVIEEAQNSMTFSDTGSERSSSNGGKGEQTNSKFASSIDGHEIPSRGIGSASPKEQQKTAALSKSSKSLESKDAPIDTKGAEEDAGDDHFGEMPENEANMKKVTVLMGRGTALDDEEPPAHEMEVISLSSTPLPTTIKASLPRTTSEAETSSLGSTSHLFKVSEIQGEEVVEGGTKPYPDDSLNLVLTLPDEGQTRIEFGFDLVNDDPVQVAREMVTELEEVPDDAVLEVSGAISGVARQARMKQNQWTKLQQQYHQQNALAQQALQQQQPPPQGMMMHPPGSVMQQPGMQAPPGTIMMPQQHMYGSGFAAGSFQAPAGSLSQPHLGTPGNDPATAALHHPPQQQAPAQIQPSQPQHSLASQQPPPPPVPSLSTPQMPNPTAPQVSTPQPQQPLHMHQQMPASPAPVTQSSQQFAPQPSQPSMRRSSSISGITMEAVSHTGEMHQAQGAAQQPAQPVQQQPPPNIPNTDMIAPRQLAPPVQSQDASTTAPSSLPLQQQIQPPSQAQPPPVAIDGAADAAVAKEAAIAESEHSEVDTEELRKLEQEFEKKMQRAKKSYGTRMDNLHRSKEEAEAQHLMSLEKHEKEKVEFEKRVRMAEEEQTRRLNQIQKEFMEKKNEVRQQRAKHPPAPGQVLQNGAADSRPPLHGGHKRSSSHFDASLSSPMLAQQPSPLTEHKRNSSESDISQSILLDSSQQQTQPPRPGSGHSLPPNLPKGDGNARGRSGSTSS